MTSPSRLAALLGAESSALDLAELCERKAALLRTLAESCAAERLGDVDSAWQWEARDIGERMERQAVRPYLSQAGQPISVAYVNGSAAWTLDGKRIARRTALAAIAERMAARLG